MPDLHALTSWDWFVVAILVISGAFGAVRGLVRTVFALGAWVAALLLTPPAVAYLLAATGWNIAPLLAGAGVFLLLFVAVRLCGALLARMLSRIGLRPVDRILGLALGALRALVIITVVAVVGHQFGADRQAAWQQALSRPLLETLVTWVESWFPVHPGQTQIVRAGAGTNRGGSACAESWAS